MLGDDIAAALPGLRAEARSRMTATARVESVAVEADPLTGGDIETPTVVHAELPCRIKARGVQARPADINGVALPEVSDELHVPWDTVGLTVGLRAVIIAVGPLDPPGLLGNTYRLVSSHLGSQATAQRWGVESWPQ